MIVRRRLGKSVGAIQKRQQFHVPNLRKSIGISPDIQMPFTFWQFAGNHNNKVQRVALNVWFWHIRHNARWLFQPTGLMCEAYCAKTKRRCTRQGKAQFKTKGWARGAHHVLNKLPRELILTIYEAAGKANGENLIAAYPMLISIICYCEGYF